jgi:hypothetical protein
MIQNDESSYLASSTSKLKGGSVKAENIQQHNNLKKAKRTCIKQHGNRIYYDENLQQ